MTNWTRIIASETFTPDTVVEYEDQIKFIKYFKKKYNIKDDIFYFDGIECVDNDTNQTIPGADLNQPAKIIEKAINKYNSIPKNYVETPLTIEFIKQHKNEIFTFTDYFVPYVAHDYYKKFNMIIKNDNSDEENKLNKQGVKDYINYLSTKFNISIKIIGSIRIDYCEFQTKTTLKQIYKLIKFMNGISFDELENYEINNRNITNINSI